MRLRSVSAIVVSLGLWLADTGPEGIYQLIDRGGVLALLCLLLFVTGVGGMRGWYFLPWYVTELRAQIAAKDVLIEHERTEKKRIMDDADGWREIALTGNTNTKNALTIARRKAAD